MNVRKELLVFCGFIAVAAVVFVIVSFVGGRSEQVAPNTSSPGSQAVSDNSENIDRTPVIAPVIEPVQDSSDTQDVSTNTTEPVEPSGDAASGDTPGGIEQVDTSTEPAEEDLADESSPSDNVGDADYKSLTPEQYAFMLMYYVCGLENDDMYSQWMSPELQQLFNSMVDEYPYSALNGNTSLLAAEYDELSFSFVASNGARYKFEYSLESGVVTGLTYVD